MCSLSTLCLEMMSLWTSSSLATERQKPADPLFNEASLSLPAQSLYTTKSTLPSILHWVPGLQGLEQFVVSHCGPVEAISERSTPDPEALVPALRYRGIVPQSQTVFPCMIKCFLRSPPWGVPERYSLSPVAELSPLCYCHGMCAVALSSHFVVICKVYSSQKLLFSLHRVQTLKLL